MKLLLDEMYSPAIAAQLRARGFDVSSVHDADQRDLEGAPDADVWAAAIVQSRVLVTENVKDFRILETAALAEGASVAKVIYTTDRRFPRGSPAAVGRLTRALEAVLRGGHEPTSAMFLPAVDG